MCVIVSIGALLVLKVVHRLIQRRSYFIQVKCVHMVNLVWVVLFFGVQGGKIVSFDIK